MLPRIVVTDTVFQNHLPEKEILKELGEVINIHWKNEDEFIEKLAGADALLVQMAPITKRVVDSLDDCRIIVRYGIGVDNIDLDAVRAKGILVCNVPDYCIDEVADHTIALALAALRQVVETDRQIRNGIWENMLPRPIASFSKLNFSLLGFGRIARNVAKRAAGIGFNVKAYDPFVSAESMQTMGVEFLSLEELLSQADILSLHLPLSSDTRHIINDERIGQMKKNALIVNTSRGGLIDTKALAARLTSGHIWGAALDVFEEEPVPATHPLRTAPGVILSSHMAWYSVQSIPELQRKAAEEIRRYLTGEALLNKVR